jgi:hypothetical protein
MLLRLTSQGSASGNPALCGDAHDRKSTPAIPPFGARALKNRIINNENIVPFFTGERLEGFFDDFGSEKRCKAEPVDMGSVFQPVNRILLEITAFSITCHVQIYAPVPEHQAEQVYDYGNNRDT